MKFDIFWKIEGVGESSRPPRLHARHSQSCWALFVEYRDVCVNISVSF